MIKKLIIWSAVGILCIIIFIFFGGSYYIPQNGMYPGLPANSRILGWKLAFSDSSSVKRGEIIIFRREQLGQSYVYIWRVVGLPGDRVETSGQTLSINGEAVKREYLRDADGEMIFREQIDGTSYEVAFDKSPRDYPPNVSITVPPNEFFVMGDNRFDAVDSRYFGTIPFAAIICRKIL
jgi:signal peptidase I